ncbi:hypothetical protein SAMN05660766_1888 [Curtobacterium sp. 314Chir4.1]|uniref:DUF6325 family protein n=1 Tax=Curtobacterium sp. 314Chir4.1 TaxID=1279028 RepID=UPI000BD39EDF|nr:DUF6325 family protein [Curtobacterium sp. 314Chir4.1]SOC88190.1 hypothetical protein SAMN05660766_1888 [Curtobacterium sp. 314Chir4.1]
MVRFEFGPVEAFVVRFRSDVPIDAVFRALGDVERAGTVRLLDFALVVRDEDGAVAVREVDDLADLLPDDVVELAARGLTANEDIEQVAESVQPGWSAAIVVIELLWAKSLAERFTENGSELLATVRIPAPAVNELAAAAHIG